jgi:hypothetical protein
VALEPGENWGSPNPKVQAKLLISNAAKATNHTFLLIVVSSFLHDTP